jgi:hypothetical protein
MYVRGKPFQPGVMLHSRILQAFQAKWMEHSSLLDSFVSYKEIEL